MVLFWLAFGLVMAFGFVVFFGAPYVPSHARYVRKAFEGLYKLGPEDVLLDLGAGDGVVLREAALRGARAIGFELNPLLVVIGRLLSRRHKGVSMKVANIWTTPFPDDVTVVYFFAVKRDVGKLQRRIQAEATRLGRPLYVISYSLELPDQKTIKTVGAHHLCKIEPLHVEKPQV